MLHNKLTILKNKFRNIAGDIEKTDPIINELQKRLNIASKELANTQLFAITMGKKSLHPIQFDGKMKKSTRQGQAKEIKKANQKHELTVRKKETNNKKNSIFQSQLNKELNQVRRMKKVTTYKP